MTETVGAHYHIDAISDAAAITFTVGYFGASGSSSMAAARSALPVAGCCGATKAAAPVRARATITDLRMVLRISMLHAMMYSARLAHCMVN